MRRSIVGLVPQVLRPRLARSWSSAKVTTRRNRVMAAHRPTGHALVVFHLRKDADTK